MFTFLLEAVCFDSIKKISIVFRGRRNDEPDVVFINDKPFGISICYGVLRCFSTHTRNITEININSCMTIRTKPRLSFKDLLNILLENGQKHKWKLRSMSLFFEELPLTLLRRFIIFAANTLEELKVHPFFPYFSKKFPAKQLTRCIKLQELTLGAAAFDLDGIQPILQSQLELVVFRICLAPDYCVTIAAILKRFRRTLKELCCDPTENLSFDKLLNNFGENDEPIGKLEYFNCTWIADLLENTNVEKLFRLFPKLKKISAFENYNEAPFNVFARQFLKLFRYHPAKRQFKMISSFYRGTELDLVGVRLAEAFPPEEYTWEIKLVNDEPEEIVIQLGNAKITLFCLCW